MLKYYITSLIQQLPVFRASFYSFDRFYIFYIMQFCMFYFDLLTNNFQNVLPCFSSDSMSRIFHTRCFFYFCDLLVNPFNRHHLGLKLDFLIYSPVSISSFGRHFFNLFLIVVLKNVDTFVRI